MRKREFALLVAPSMIVMFGLLAPAAGPHHRSGASRRSSTATPGVFVGLQNYATALTDARFGAVGGLHGRS